jgi:hypothetical protein
MNTKYWHIRRIFQASLESTSSPEILPIIPDKGSHLIHLYYIDMSAACTKEGWQDSPTHYSECGYTEGPNISRQEITEDYRLDIKELKDL